MFYWALSINHRWIQKEKHGGVVEEDLWVGLCSWRWAEVHLQSRSEDQDGSQYWHCEEGPKENPVQHLSHELPVLHYLRKNKQQLLVWNCVSLEHFSQWNTTQQIRHKLGVKGFRSLTSKQLKYACSTFHPPAPTPLVWSAPFWCDGWCSGLSLWLSPAWPARLGSHPPSLSAGRRCGQEPPSSLHLSAASAPGCASRCLGSGIWAWGAPVVRFIVMHIWAERIVK